MLREDRISRITLKEHNIYDFKDWQIYVGKSNLKNCKNCGIKDCHRADLYWDYEFKNLRMWNIKFDKNLKAKNKLHKHYVAHILKRAK